ncbi:MAG TPA: BTAD domain-containing putative transcriptional regulator [Streptosporangiaceae bacterium]|nr:BTAD domain-containing putative transcriptional regulator [Streptosporangiaceae bacterium]
MRFRILGPLDISDEAGQHVAFSRRLHRSALTLLLLNAGQPCSVASLSAGLWGDEPPLSPEVSLRSCIYGIRKALPDASRLRTHPSGYLISVQPGEFDLDDFRDLASRGRAAMDGGDAQAAAALLNQALSLWREPPLADLPAVPARERLLDQRKETQDALNDARLALGEHRQVLAELRSVVAADPLHEHAWAQLIIALYRSGARAEALGAFGRLRVTLISSQGIDPGPELQDLHRRVLADDPALMITMAPRPAALTEPAPAEPAPAEPDTASPDPWQPACQLPATVADFTGRAAELECVLKRLSGQRPAVTVVTGMLGIGKTALAVVAAHQASAGFPDGQLYACLDDGGRPRDPQVVLGELLRGLGVPAGGIPAARFEREALYRSVLAGRRVLVLADGASSAAQVRPLLPGTAGSAVLVTSRARLPDLDGARFIELGGLHPANSILLLARISGRDIADAGWDAGQDPEAEHAESEVEAARAIASACGHLPLALRIAGARLADDPELTVTDLAALLSDESRRLDELTVGGASVRTRLGAAAQSVSDPARRALAFLAAADSCETPGSVIVTLLDDADAGKLAPELVGAGLLHRVSSDGKHGRSYRLHPLAQAYAGELLSSRLITTRVGERRTTSRNPARS